MELIKRRKHAIQKLDNHSYLLKALSQPGQVYIDTNIDTQLGELTMKNVDENKVAVIKDVMRTRPIYALQGPPGTGKTTLVAHLVHELIEEDPMVQILVTAQAHGAVDVLRHKISERSNPISIRIGNKKPEGDKDFDSVEVVAKRILDKASSELVTNSCSPELMEKWRRCLDERDDKNSRFIKDFQELVKRSATITYSTASSADLATLADGSEEFDWTFDWSIFEEAGKAHGFDLALPLQTGHRWLLLGDHKQLPPHLFNDFQNMIQSLDEVNEALEVIGKLNDAHHYVDKDWLREWTSWDETKRSDFKSYSKSRLNLFKFIFETLRDSVFGMKKLTGYEPIGALSGILSTQYRMHPVIGDLISSVFYDNMLKNGTLDENGNPKSEFFTKLSFPGNKALDTAMKESSIIWLDMPDAKYFNKATDSGEDKTVAPFVNRSEILALCSLIQGLSTEDAGEFLSMAILAPYNSQTRMIRDEIEKIEIPNFLKPVRNVYARDTNETKWVHTVDSFQGNEADIVVVSLVRNNNLLDVRKSIGFLSEESRMNVLLSRGRKKLILIGSFSFYQRQIEHLQSDDVLDPLRFLKRLLDYIQEGVENKKTAIVQFSDCGEAK
jgi:ABC-type molybdenum transport system ATPase subunit/photorepair protein PhrA